MPGWWPRLVPVRLGRAVAVGGVVVVLAGAALATSSSSSGSAGTSSAQLPAAEAAGIASGGPSTGPSVGLVGDSLLFEANPQIQAELADADLRVAAWPGQHVHQLHDEAVDLADQVEVLVLVLGTNNVIDGWGHADTQQVEELLTATATVPCRRWVTITDTAGIPHHDTGAVRANAALLDMVHRHPGLQLVTWDDLIAANPHYLHSDQVHHSEEGRAAFARAIAAGVRTCP